MYLGKSLTLNPLRAKEGRSMAVAPLPSVAVMRHSVSVSRLGEGVMFMTSPANKAALVPGTFGSIPFTRSIDYQRLTDQCSKSAVTCRNDFHCRKSHCGSSPPKVFP
jgi:hypothetical protein